MKTYTALDITLRKYESLLYWLDLYKSELTQQVTQGHVLLLLIILWCIYLNVCGQMGPGSPPWL